MFSSERVGEDIPVMDGRHEMDFTSFYSSSAPRTLALAYSLTANWSDAEDLVQDAYADAHRRWAELANYDDPAGWVRRAVINRSKSRWRRIRREVAAFARLTDQGTSELVDADGGPDHEFWAEVRRLPPQQRRVVGLYYVEDLSVDQIASALSCSSGTVKTHLSRARATLHERLGNQSSKQEETS